MTPERYHRVGQIYHDALQIEPERRSAFLDASCEGDAALREEVERMLTSYERMGNFLAEPAIEIATGPLANKRADDRLDFQTRPQPGDPAGQGGNLAGQEIGHYEALSLLGVGGMGQVWLARDLRLRRKVALKILPVEFTDDPIRVRRFVQEAQAASALNHPNIITIYEIGQFRGAHYIATELIEGETLRRRMPGGKSPIAAALDVAIQVASALSAAHQAGIVHRDIKPENVMARPDGIVKVLDFGLAKLTERDLFTNDTDSGQPTRANINTEPGLVMGTVAYMSPEQARGVKVDARSDLFSLGVMLYEMVTGCRPFDGRTKMDALAAILEREPAPLGKYFEAEPESLSELQRIVSKALRKEVEERYRTAGELLDDLKGLKQELDFGARLGNSAASTPRRRAPGNSAPGRDAGIDPKREHSSVKIILGEIRRHRKGVAFTLAVITLIALAAGYGIFKLIILGSREQSFQSMKFAKLTQIGNVAEIPPAISPDGKYVAFVAKEGDQQSLWVTHGATGSRTQIVPPAEVAYKGVTFSRDGDYIFYSISNKKDSSALYQVAFLGGPPKLLLMGIDSAISFSPDGARFAYVGEQEAALMIADKDGSGAQKVMARPSTERMDRVAWSPDGEVVICSVIAMSDGERRLVAVRVKDHRETPVGAQRWARLSGMSWLADGSGLIVGGAEKGTRLQQVWSLSYPEGEPRRVTNDLNNYLGVSLTADSQVLACVRSERLSNIWIAPGAEADAPRALTFETGRDDGLSGLAWTADDKIIFTARTVASEDLWVVDLDGNQKQITTDSTGNLSPAVSPDGRDLAFVSKRGGYFQIWRMGMVDGSIRQLTFDAGTATSSRYSPDGRWIVYTFNPGDQENLWKVPVEGGQPLRLTDVRCDKPAISPDGKWVACVYGERTLNSPARIALIPFEGGAPAKLLDWPSVAKSALLQWAPDGRGLIYVDVRERVYNLWVQPLDGGRPRQLTDFKADRIFSFAWSRDGKRLACARGNIASDVVRISDFQR